MVSVIITTKNSEKYIADCIQSVLNSTYKDTEIIVVDNCSTDRTRDIAVDMGAKVYMKGPERSAQRNYGVAKSKGEYVLILDVDMTIHRCLLDECIYMTTDENGYRFDGLYIPEEIIGKGFWVKVRNFERSFYDGTRIDAIRFMRKTHWLNYDERLTGAEDWDHDRRFKGKKWITQRSLYHNENDFSFSRYIAKKRYYSQWLDIYKKKYGNCPELDPFYRYFWVFMEGGKWKRSLAHPILLCAMLFMRLLVGVNYLCVKKY